MEEAAFLRKDVMNAVKGTVRASKANFSDEIFEYNGMYLFMIFKKSVEKIPVDMGKMYDGASYIEDYDFEKYDCIELPDDIARQLACIASAYGLNLGIVTGIARKYYDETTIPEKEVNAVIYVFQRSGGKRSRIRPAIIHDRDLLRLVGIHDEDNSVAFNVAERSVDVIDQPDIEKENFKQNLYLRTLIDEATSNIEAARSTGRGPVSDDPDTVEALKEAAKQIIRVERKVVALHKGEINKCKIKKKNERTMDGCKCKR